jgi:tRNA(Arg) A34 adenosine deaminase TadA
MKQDRVLSHLHRLAKKTEGIDGGRVRMAAAIVHKKRIVSTGVNRMKSHPIMMSSGYRTGQDLLHAETDAIVRSGLKDFSDYDLYVVRILKSDEFALAKPCDGCSEILNTLNFKNVYYTTNDGDLDVL